MTTFDAPTLALLLGDWAAGPDPLNEQLADAIARAIARGDVGPGARLPSERDLGVQLGVSRSTIVAAYDRLRERGVIRSRQGSGTRVAEPLHGAEPFTPGRSGLMQPYLVEPRSSHARVGMAAVPAAPELEDTAPVPGTRAGRRPRRSGAPTGAGQDGSPAAGTIAMTIGALPGWPLVADAIREVAEADLPDLLEDFGYMPMGLPLMRSAIARTLTRLGVPTTPDEIIVTNGAQQAVHLVFDQLAGPEGVVALENPTYVGAVDSAHAVGARMVPVPTGPDGMRLDILHQILGGEVPSFVYVVPTFHNPTGTVMPESARRELAGLALERGVTIVEDLTPAIGLAGPRHPRPIAAFAPRDRVVTIGSLSKGGWAGLRLGWIRCERSLVARLVARKTVADHGTSILVQAVGARMLDRLDELDEHAEAESRIRREVAEAALRELLPDWSWTRPSGGLCFWVRLPSGDANAFARLAAEHGVLVRPGTFASPDGGFRDHIRIAVGESPERVREGIERLASAWAVFRPAGTRPGPAMAVSV